jgi:chromosome segregation ATPase
MTSTEYRELVEFLGRQFTAMDRRFTEVDGRVAELRRDILGHFDEIYRRFERLEQEYQAIAQALRRIEMRLSDETTRRERLERDVVELKGRVAALLVRIEEIERRLAP